ncbi:MAG: YhdH/YhfP family quinone oxidoreductase, partial [Porticoccaceae bacterium]|nr:YhdH/YhfP family quinone oxidoreductase [Porticoccaceae bacterium]
HYSALVIEEQNGQFVRSVQQRSLQQLSAEPLSDELLVRVHYSSLNYKDALSAIGNKGVTRNFPHVPGIDAVGTVEQSGASQFSPGDKVIVTSYDLGMETDGGFGQYIRIPATWALALPETLSEKQAMILGTAGLTAGLCVHHIVKSIAPEDGPIAVSGASGGVGSLAVAILAKLGYQVSAISGKDSDFLQQLGASEVIPRAELGEENPRPLLKARFAAAVDTVGGPILANILKSTQANGIVTCCGLVASPDLPITVFPFILRGISLIGIDSQDCPMARRVAVWNKLATEWKPDQLMGLYDEVSLEQLDGKIDLILQGKLQGRTVVHLGG